MSELYAGCALLDRRAKGVPKLYGRVIYINEIEDLAVVAQVPGKNKHGYQKNYVPRPRHCRLSALLRQVDGDEFSVAEFETPTHWLLTTEQLLRNSTAGASQKTRRDLRKWVRRRAKAYGRIRPFVHGRSIDEIVMDSAIEGWAAKRAKEIPGSSISQIQRDLNVYLLSMGLRNGLLPWYTNNGGPNKPKYSRKKTGRQGEFNEGKNCNERVRQIFQLGWKKYKKPGVSAKEAFARTRNEWFCKSIRWIGSTAKVTLKPDAHLYTLNQFIDWGQKGKDALTATQIASGETEARKTHLRRQNKIKDRHLSVNGEAFLDSTSTDQTLVSVASRLKVLSAPWRTDVMGASVDYIFGHHVGFESPSGMTALMSILHAAQDKVEYCARYGIKIKPRDWLSMTFRQFVMDNGEGKGELVMRTLEDMECGASYGPAYDAINKAPVESGHNRTQSGLDHLLPASTMGRRAKRGEPERATMAIFNFHEYMPRLIERVLHHNNVERIVLPSLEMRQDGVEPTRRGVVEWMLAKGYVASTPTDLRALRVHCLPRLKACFQADGLHLYDPTYSGKRIIPHLLYRSDWLMRSALLMKASSKRWSLEAHLNPSDMSQLWVNLDGLKCLHLVSADPEMNQLTLLDWLAICRDDRLSGFLARVDETSHRVNRIAAVKRDVQEAKRERKAEIMDRGQKPTKSELKSDKRDNTAVEKAVQTGIPMPPKKKESPARELAQRDRPIGAPKRYIPLGNDFDDVIEALRRL